jgi:hypothetical protein
MISPIRLATALSISVATLAVRSYIKRNPGSRLFQIDRATLRSYNTWGAKSILLDLETRGLIYAKRTHHGKKVPPTYYATI